LAKNLKQGGPLVEKGSKEAAKMEEGKPQIILAGFSPSFKNKIKSALD